MKPMELPPNNLSCVYHAIQQRHVSLPCNSLRTKLQPPKILSKCLKSRHYHTHISSPFFPYNILTWLGQPCHMARPFATSTKNHNQRSNLLLAAAFFRTFYNINIWPVASIKTNSVAWTRKKRGGHHYRSKRARSAPGTGMHRSK